jgi:hypothetical protein
MFNGKGFNPAQKWISDNQEQLFGIRFSIGNMSFGEENIKPLYMDQYCPLYEYINKTPLLKSGATKKGAAFSCGHFFLKVGKFNKAKYVKKQQYFRVDDIPPFFGGKLFFSGEK